MDIKIPTLQCQKPKHNNDELTQICLDKNCPDFLKLFCSNCQLDHFHKTQSLKGTIEQIADILSAKKSSDQGRQDQQKITNYSINYEFEKILSNITNLIFQAQELYKKTKEIKDHFEVQNNIQLIVQLLSTIEDQDEQGVIEILKKSFKILDVNLQNQVATITEQKSLLSQDLEKYQTQMQRFVDISQNTISEALKMKCDQELINQKFNWSYDCEAYMRQSLSTFEINLFPEYCKNSMNKWKQLFSNLMQKSLGKKGFCGVRTKGFYQSKDNKYSMGNYIGACGTSNGVALNQNLAYEFYCCETCWKLGKDEISL